MDKPAWMYKFGSLAALIALWACLCSGGCSKGSGEQGQYEALTGGGFGVGISFGQSREAVTAKLGASDGFVERQGGASVDEYYRPQFSRKEEGVPRPADTHTMLTYANDSLARIYAHYNPTAQQDDLPPLNPEPLPGIKLGSTRQQFDEALGTADEETPYPKWVFVSDEGSQVMLVAQFTDPNAIEGVEAKTGPADVVCVSMTIAHAGPTSERRGEEYEKAREREKRLKEDY